MGLTSLQLIPTLFCLLACSGNVVRRRQCNITLPEIITTLNFLEKDKSPCTELTIADVFAVPKQHGHVPTSGYMGRTCLPLVLTTSIHPQNPEGRAKWRVLPRAAVSRPKDTHPFIQQNTSEMETLCRAATALRQFYSHHEKETFCRNATVLQHRFLIKYLKGLDRNLYSMTDMKDCPVNEAKKRTLKNFLERLKMNMQKKISEWC